MLTHWKKLAIPVALGVSVAWLNWINVAQQVESYDYVAVGKDVKPGEAIQVEDLRAFTVKHSRDVRLDTALIPWTKRNLLVGYVAQRTLTEGDLLTQRDLANEIVLLVDSTKSETEDVAVFVGDLVDIKAQRSGKLETFITGARLISLNRESGLLRARVSVDPAQRLNMPRGWRHEGFQLSSAKSSTLD